VIAFVLILVALVIVALLWVLPVLLRRHYAGGTAAAESSLAVLKDQLTELDRDLANGTLSPQQYREARDDLDRRVLEDVREAALVQRGFTNTARWTLLSLLVVIPVASVLLYFQLGSPDAISWTAPGGGEHGVTAKDVEAMVARLAARLDRNPDDANGWALLGRSYVTLKRFPEAADAYARAVALVKDDPDLLADYADALAMSQDRRIEGEPLALVERALQINPMQWKALAMAGSAAFERRDYKQAVAYWERLQQGAEPDSEFARSLEASLNEARQLGGIKAPPKAAAGRPEGKAPPPVDGASVEGTVALAPQLKDKAAAGDTVFIFARAAEGPRMPLAIMRLQVRDLPAKFRLDDTQAMAPALKLSNFPEVVVGARVSKSGSATPQSGDWQGASQKIKVGARNVAIVIDTPVP